MDKVFILRGYYNVSTNENPERDLIGVFSTKEEAEKTISIWKEFDSSQYCEGFDIDEFYVDRPLLPLMYKKIPDVEL